jgi:hypothetical protein
MVLQKALGGFAVGTPSFSLKHWVVFSKPTNGPHKTIGWFTLMSGGPFRNLNGRKL